MAYYSILTNQFYFQIRSQSSFLMNNHSYRNISIVLKQFYTGVYNLYLMSTNQRTPPFWSKLKIKSPSINIQIAEQSPPLPLPHSYNKKPSSPKYHNITKNRIQGTRSQTVYSPKHSKNGFSKDLTFKSTHSHQNKWKVEDLRETDDSVRPKQRRKQLSLESFKVLKQLGKGKRGTVFLAIHKDTGFVGALKVFSKQSLNSLPPLQMLKQEEELIRQLKIQSFINHEHIIKLFSIFADKAHVYAFMELGSDGQLFQIFEEKKKLKQETISFVNRSLLQALSHLHSKGVIHRDVKPENIVLIHGFPKICDFGESNFYSKEKGQLRETLCGTPLYLSPQILIGDKYDEKIDIWALGAMAYQLFTGMNPFNIKNKDQLTRIVTHQFKMSEGSIEICNFLTHCLKKHPLERPNAFKLLRHPFISKWRELQTAEQLCTHKHL